MKRYHLTLGHRRTTVSLDNLLSGLLAIRLGTTPQSPQAHDAVRAWLQQQLDRNNDPGRCRVSQWLRDEVLLFLVDNTLADAYIDWWIEHDSYSIPGRKIRIDG
jgi:hypothetical protein